MKTNDELRKDVMDEIKWNPEFHDVATEIGVAVKDGVVTLSGTVDTYRKKVAAEKAAQHVAGVKVVASDVEIKVGLFGKKTDTEIAEAVKNALRWNSSVKEEKIDVKVDNGWVYLDGEVDWHYQRSSIKSNIENLWGVRGVVNNITVQPKAVDLKVLKSKIAKAFHCTATLDSLDPSELTVEANNGRVTLSGTVKSWAERKQAERVAWSSPGVTTVDNKIEIDAGVYV